MLDVERAQGQGDSGRQRGVGLTLPWSGGFTIRAQIGKRVRDLRITVPITQEELAAKTGISVSFLSMIERGERRPTLKTLVVISEAMGVTLSQFFSEVKVPQENIGQTGPLLATRLEDLRLSQDQVEILIVVARAMFERHGTNQPRLSSQVADRD